jgi:hypothetical protein
MKQGDEVMAGELAMLTKKVYLLLMSCRGKEFAKKKGTF